MPAVSCETLAGTLEELRLTSRSFVTLLNILLKMGVVTGFSSSLSECFTSTEWLRRWPWPRMSLRWAIEGTVIFASRSGTGGAGFDGGPGKGFFARQGSERSAGSEFSFFFTVAWSVTAAFPSSDLVLLCPLSCAAPASAPSPASLERLRMMGACLAGRANQPTSAACCCCSGGGRRSSLCTRCTILCSCRLSRLRLRSMRMENVAEAGLQELRFTDWRAMSSLKPTRTIS
mmetsp:Transcript_14437/g.56771  ORF Transcript_14437/g.56771 Transcript_14437/m.56771 type:complete len:231 (-) Transcript_14437:1387-2079(-)